MCNSLLFRGLIMFTDNYSFALKQRFLFLFEKGYSLDYIREDINNSLNIDLSDPDISKLTLILKLRQNKNYEDLPGEEWRSLDIISYPLYFVSNKGRVRRMNRLKSIKKNQSGYLEINLYRLGKFVTRTIHRLVLIGFTRVLMSDKQINHKDMNKENNNLENLEWCTAKENIEHLRRNNLVHADNSRKAMTGENNMGSKLKPEDVIYIRNSNLSNKELGLSLGVKPEQIRRIRKRKAWKHLN